MSGRQKIPLRQAIVVEGRYDKAKVSRLFETLIVETGGFQLFSDEKKLNLLRRLAAERGIIVLTDGDGAGFVIRNYLKGAVKGEVLHAYIPDLYGKEKRKARPSAEGKLGVEGVPDEVIIQAVRAAGAGTEETPGSWLTRARLYEDGFFGRQDSREKRRRLLAKLGLPEHLSVTALCQVLGILMDEEAYERWLKGEMEAAEGLSLDP